MSHNFSMIKGHLYDIKVIGLYRRDKDRFTLIDGQPDVKPWFVISFGDLAALKYLVIATDGKNYHDLLRLERTPMSKYSSKMSEDNFKVLKWNNITLNDDDKQAISDAIEKWSSELLL